MGQHAADSIQRLIKAHAEIFGRDIAIRSVLPVKDLQIDKSGKIKKITGDTNVVLQSVIRCYASISGTLSYQILTTVR